VSTPGGAGGGGWRTAVVGAVNVDLVVTAAKLPGPGDTVVGEGPQDFGGGKGANAAVAAARAGGDVMLIGAVGADETGAAALAELEEEGVDVAGVARLSGVATGVALIVVDEGGENQIAVGAGANGAIGGGDVVAALEPVIDELGCLLISTEISEAGIAAALELASEANVACVVNPAPPTQAVIEGIGRGPLLTPNAGELSALLGMLDVIATGNAAADARKLCEFSQAPVIVTLGGDGILIISASTGERWLPAPAAEVRDTTGAGDTFNGVLASRLAAGDELERAAGLAVLAASLSVGKEGARSGMPEAEAIAPGLRVDRRRSNQQS
jgi:ribokinase